MLARYVTTQAARNVADYFQSCTNFNAETLKHIIIEAMVLQYYAPNEKFT